MMKSLSVIAGSLALASAVVLVPREPMPTPAPQGLVSDLQSLAANQPVTQTLTNGAVIVASGSVTTTVQGGASMTVQMDPSASANIGTMNGDELFTAISNSLEAACPTPTSGQTVTACATPSPVTGIIYVAYNEEVPENDGDLVIDVPIVSYSDPSVREGLIQAIAQAARNTANMPSNHHQQKYAFRGAYYPGTSGPYFDMANVGSVIEAIYTDQDASTGGVVQLQDMLVTLAFEPYDGGEFACADVALGADMASLLSLIPGLEWLAFAGPALSIVCAVTDNDPQT